MNELANILRTIEPYYEQMKQTLLCWGGINSGSYHEAGIKRIQQEVSSYFKQLPGQMTFQQSQPYHYVDDQGEIQDIKLGDMLHIVKDTGAPCKVLLCGHLDTVFPASDLFQRCQLLADDMLAGPGVADMKGGLLVLCHSLLALSQTPLAKKLDWEIILNADEELGSPVSSSFIHDAAERCDVGLGFEPSLSLAGEFAGKRKGSRKYSLIAHGQAAHVGRAFKQGRNAILALGEMVQQIHHFNDTMTDIIINVGCFHGGSAVNQVAETAVARLDVRATSDEVFVQFDERLKMLADFIGQEFSVVVDIHLDGQRPAKPLTVQNQQLYDLLEVTAKELSMEYKLVETGGCCDGNTMAGAGLANIDTLGVVGEGIHTRDEKMYLPSLVERTQLTTALLYKIIAGEYKPS